MTPLGSDQAATPAPASGWRWYWAALCAWSGLVMALYGAFLTPFRVGTVLVPLALIIAVAGNASIMMVARRLTGSAWLALLPGVTWLVVTFVFSGSTTEGDLVLYQGNWVAAVYLLAGSATVAVAAVRMLRRPPGRGPR